MRHAGVEPPDRARSRRWGIAVVTLLLVALGAAIAVDVAEGDEAAQAEQRGVSALAEAIARPDGARFDAATAAFERAVSADWLSDRPPWLVHATERVEAYALGQAAETPGGMLERYYALLAAGRYAEAEALAREQTADRDQRDDLVWLATSLAAADATVK